MLTLSPVSNCIVTHEDGLRSHLARRLTGVFCAAPQVARHLRLCGAGARRSHSREGCERAGRPTRYPTVGPGAFSFRSAPTPCTNGMKIRPRNKMLKMPGVPPLCAVSTSPSTVSNAYSTIPA